MSAETAAWLLLLGAAIAAIARAVAVAEPAPLKIFRHEWRVSYANRWVTRRCDHCKRIEETFVMVAFLRMPWEPVQWYYVSGPDRCSP